MAGEDGRSQVLGEFLEQVPSESPWFGTGQNSQASQSKGKAGSLRDTCSLGRMRSSQEGRGALGEHPSSSVGHPGR